MAREFKFDTLKLVARQIKLEGRSKLRKAELESAVMKTREGRKAIYELDDQQFAIEAIETCRASGAFLLPREHVKGLVEGEFRSLHELHRAHADNGKKRASYLGKMRAIKELVVGQRLSREMRWSEDDAGFRLALVRRQAA